MFYIDTKRDFSAKRIKEMVSNTNLVGDVMERILVSKINSLHELINTLHNIKTNFKKFNLRLIILDSLPPLIYQMEELQTAYGLLNHAVNVMRFLITQYHVVFLVTNALTNWVEGCFGNEENAHSEKIGCGKYWFNVPNTRLKISNVITNREVTVLKSTYLASGAMCYVKINKLGVSDLE